MDSIGYSLNRHPLPFTDIAFVFLRSRVVSSLPPPHVRLADRHYPSPPPPCSPCICWVWDSECDEKIDDIASLIDKSPKVWGDEKVGRLEGSVVAWDK